MPDCNRKRLIAFQQVWLTNRQSAAEGLLQQHFAARKRHVGHNCRRTCGRQRRASYQTRKGRCSTLMCGSRLKVRDAGGKPPTSPFALFH
ncbi:hypothetical protein SAMCFNEI73_Ch3151 [Sinorhizobium americanum]|uniref:Uncharacterized protein n=1 Tax=Sinorhizobium americanum TaxID=194963 RepID=A0A1L3LQQ9_9HYPH|nr:hypothetical protein SAMCFNEI73_Ch3151 [Sinorhizobium americanum]